MPCKAWRTMFSIGNGQCIKSFGMFFWTHILDSSEILQACKSTLFQSASEFWNLQMNFSSLGQYFLLIIFIRSILFTQGNFAIQKSCDTSAVCKCWPFGNRWHVLESSWKSLRRFSFKAKDEQIRIWNFNLPHGWSRIKFDARMLASNFEKNALRCS